MELHGGTLTLRSKLGHGTSATMRFPGRRVMLGR
jgi:signal transduction histidine kinase